MAAVFALPAAPANAAEFFNTAGEAIAPSIAVADPLQNGQLDGGAATTCGTAPTSTVVGTAPDYPTGGHRSDRYSPFTNHTEQQQCVTVALDPQTCTVRSAAYVPSFNAASIGANLAGDSGPPAGGASTYEFLVGPGRQFAVVVGSVEAAASCPAYHVALSSALPWATGPMGLTGGAVTGESVSGSATWSGAPSIARQWSRCDATGTGCAPIDGATGTTYVPTDADVGHTLRATEVADEGGQQASASALTTPVQSGRPRPAHNRATVSNTSVVDPATDLVPGSQGTGADDATFDFGLPFPVSFYGTEYTRAGLGTNGVIQFESSNGSPFNAALPTTRFGPAILAHWDDLVTTNPSEGIFTSVTGEAPNRVLHVEWRAHLYTGGGPVNFEVRLREGSPVISLVYGVVSGAGGSATVGMQAAPTATLAEPFPFSTPTGLQLDYTSSRPTVAGAAREGAELTGTDAQWIGPGPIATAFQWLACDAQGGGCAEVPGATGASFTPGGAHVGQRLRLRSTATNDRGSTALVSDPTAPVASAQPPDKTPPVISSLRLSNASFRVARGITPVSAAAKRRARAKRGTNIRSVVTERGKASYAIQRELRGRQVGTRCVKPARKLRKRKRCWRYRAVHTLTRTVGQGTNVFWFTGRLGSLALIPNRYRVVMRVRDAAGNVSLPRWARFRIVAR